MKKTLGAVLLITCITPWVIAAEVKMAKPGQAGWQAAEGDGCLVWNPDPQPDETVTWSGACKGNRASGQGELVWSFPGSTDRYVGEMHDGKRNGKGAAVSPAGDRYEGNWLNGKLNGYGSVVTKKGGTYEGDWVDGRPHGKGVRIYANGDRYEGEFVKGKPTRGEMTRADGS